MTIKTPNRFSAVSIVCTSASCPAAQALKGQRYLSAKAPRLPLADCASPATCACTYRKYLDLYRTAPDRDKVLQRIEKLQGKSDRDAARPGAG